MTAPHLPAHSTEVGQHAFIGITMMPVDLRLNDENEVEYSPLEGAEETPRFVCRLCQQPGFPEVVDAACPGPDVDKMLSELGGHTG